MRTFLDTPHRISRTGDDSAAVSVFRYVWRMTGWHQVAVCALAISAALINLVPLELQRLIVNEVVETQNVSALLIFGAIYVAVLLVHQAIKLIVRLYQGWLSESAVLYTRTHILELYRNTLSEDREESGRTVSMVNAEVEKLGGFVGETVSDAAANCAILIGVMSYMLFVEPRIALFALAFLVPQVVIVPLMQRRLNELVEERVGYMRALGDRITDLGPETGEERSELLPKIYANRIRFFVLKFVLKAVLNLLRAVGPVTVLLLGGYLVMQGETEIGVIVAFISGFGRLADPLRELIGFYRLAAQTHVQHSMIAKWIDERV